LNNSQILISRHNQDNTNKTRNLIEITKAILETISSLFQPENKFSGRFAKLEELKMPKTYEKKVLQE